MEESTRHIKVVVAGRTIADTHRAKRVLETSQAPAYYISPEDVAMQHLQPSEHHTFCEWKGQASYFTIAVGDDRRENAAWYYAEPAAGFESIRNYLAFYPQKVDQALVDGEQAQSQEGGFYGGWITNEIVGFEGQEKEVESGGGDMTYEGLNVSGPIVDDESGLRSYTVRAADAEFNFGILPQSSADGVVRWSMRVGADRVVAGDISAEPYDTPDEAYQAGLRAARLLLLGQTS